MAHNHFTNGRSTAQGSHEDTDAQRIKYINVCRQHRGLLDAMVAEMPSMMSEVSRLFTDPSKFWPDVSSVAQVQERLNGYEYALHELSRGDQFGLSAYSQLCDSYAPKLAALSAETIRVITDRLSSAKQEAVQRLERICSMMNDSDFGSGVQHYSSINTNVLVYLALAKNVANWSVKQACTTFADRWDEFILVYGKAISAVMAYSSAEVISAYTAAISPVEVASVAETLEAKLGAAVAEHKKQLVDIVRSLPSVFPSTKTSTTKAEVKKKALLRFLDHALTPHANPLYKEMMLVSSSDTYTQHRRRLNDKVCDLRAALKSVHAASYSKLPDSRRSEIDHLAAQSYLDAHPELRSMVYVRKEAELYASLYDQLRSGIGIAQVSSHPHVQPATTPSANASSASSLSPNALSANTSSARAPVSSVLSSAAELEVMPSMPVYDATTQLYDIKEPVHPSLVSLYCILHRIGRSGFVSMKSPMELAAAIDSFDLARIVNGSDANGKQATTAPNTNNCSGTQLAAEDKEFIRAAVGYLWNVSACQYGYFGADNPIAMNVPRFLRTATEYLERQ